MTEEQAIEIIMRMLNKFDLVQSIRILDTTRMRMIHVAAAKNRRSENAIRSEGTAFRNDPDSSIKS